MNNKYSILSLFFSKGRTKGAALWKIPTVSLEAILVAMLLTTAAAAEHLPPFGLSQTCEASAARYIAAADADDSLALSSNRGWEAIAAQYTGLAAFQSAASASTDSYARLADFYAAQVASRLTTSGVDADPYAGLAAFYDAAVASRLGADAIEAAGDDALLASCARSRLGGVDVFTLGYPTP